jgi:ribosomal protection tetracycline resistance protein
MYAGTIKLREKYCVAQKPDLEIQIKTLESINGAKLVLTNHVSVGEIGVLTNVDGLHVGDVIGVHSDGIRTVDEVKPIFSANIHPVKRADRQPLLDALSEMNIEDEQLDFTISDSQITVKLFGELQKEFIKTQLSDRYGIDTEFSETQTIFKETPVGIGRVDTGFIAFIIEPLPKGTGIIYEENRRTGLPGLTESMRDAVKETAMACLVPGALMVNEGGVVVPFRPGVHGWEVTDIRIIFDNCHYRSSPSEFRGETPYAIRKAIRSAGTQILEPIYCYEIVAHTDFCGKTVSEINNYNGSIATMEDNGNYMKLTGKLPARISQAFLLQFQTITKNMGNFDALGVEYEPYDV